MHGSSSNQAHQRRRRRIVSRGPGGRARRPAAAILAVAAAQLRGKHQAAELAVQNIHDQLDVLDPATRAAVIVRLSSDEA